MKNKENSLTTGLKYQGHPSMQRLAQPRSDEPTPNDVPNGHALEATACDVLGDGPYSHDSCARICGDACKL